jgi:hypothetical protein
MAWRRIGKIWGPDGSLDWARTHASLPVAVSLQGEEVRIYFSARDSENCSSVGWVDVALSESPKVLRIGDRPVVRASAPGHFDDSGIGIGSIVNDGQHDRLYYMGWNLGRLAPWRNSIGLAIGDARTGQFQKAFRGPIMDRSPEDPYTISYPWVLRLAADKWRMWYGSNIAWGGSSADMQHVIKAASSSDGVNWLRSEAPAVGFAEPGEYALARPCVIADRGRFLMWFATRGEQYRIGSAISSDGETWTRTDPEHGLLPATEGWDCEMVCYPCVFDHKGRRLMLYNGNAYGRDGFGLAIWEAP